MTTLAAPQFIDPQYLVNTFGLIGLTLIIFAECGLLIGFFLPGDSLLFTAGLLASQHYAGLPLWALLICASVAAIAGNVVGYGIGYRAGPAVFRREESRLFKRQYVDQAHAFFEKYGARTIVLARFVPVVRTFATVMAGASRMRFQTFLLYSVIGGISWGAGVSLLGFYLGKIAFVRDHIELIIVGVVVISVLPVVFEFVRARRRTA